MKLKIRSSLLLLIALFFVLQISAETNSELFDKARTAFLAQKHDEAIYNCLTILANNPDQDQIINTHWHCAISYYNLGLYREALYYYKKTTELTDHDMVWGNLGGFASQMGYDDLAVYALDSLIRKNPMYVLAYSIKGGNDIAYNRLESAEQNLKKAIEVDSTYSGSYLNLSIVYKYQNKEDERAKYLNKYSKFVPNDLQVALIQYEKQKGKKRKEYRAQLEKGIESCTKTLKANRYSVAVFTRARIYKALDKKELAKRDYLQALDIYNQTIEDLPDSWQMYLFRAEIYEELGEYSKSLADYEAVFRMNPLHPAVQKNIDSVKKKLEERK